MQTYHNFSTLDENFRDVTVKGPQYSSGVWDYYLSEIKNGNRCYEIDWIEGVKCFMIGFVFNDIMTFIFTNFDNDPQYIERLYDQTQVGSRFTLNAKVTVSTVMFCANSFTPKMSIIVENVKQTFHPQTFFSNPTILRIVLSHGRSFSSSDRLKINYGSEPFINKLPYGYTSWISNSSFSFTKQKSNLYPDLSLVVLLIDYNNVYS